MGKTRDVFEKTGDIKGAFHTRLGTVKDRNSKDVGEAEVIRKRWQEHIELYKKDLNDPDEQDGSVTHLQSDIMEGEVKWALKTITTNNANGDNEIAAVLFKILKYDAIKVLHSICQQIWKTQQWPQDW